MWMNALEIYTSVMRTQRAEIRKDLTIVDAIMDIVEMDLIAQVILFRIFILSFFPELFSIWSVWDEAHQD